MKFQCSGSKKCVKSNQDAILCASCTSWSHVKCLGMTKTMFQYYLKHPEIDWTCAFCALPKLDDSFFVDKSIEDTLSVTCTGSEELNTTSSSTTSSEVPTVWYKKHIYGYDKHNLAIDHLNVNSILGKIDEVLDLLTNCRFDILFISETKIDKSVPSSLLSSPHRRSKDGTVG